MCEELRATKTTGRRGRADVWFRLLLILVMLLPVVILFLLPGGGLLGGGLLFWAVVLTCLALFRAMLGVPEQQRESDPALEEAGPRMLHAEEQPGACARR